MSKPSKDLNYEMQVDDLKPKTKVSVHGLSTVCLLLGFLRKGHENRS